MSVAVLGYLAVRGVGVLALAAAGGWSAGDLLHALTDRYDAQSLLAIARHGYDDGATAPSNLAFFPLQPLLASLLGPDLAPFTALTISVVAGAAAAAGIYAVGRRVCGPTGAALAAIAWGALPHAITQSMAYTESLFTALAAWALWGVLRRRWVIAGVLCALAGATRATGWTLIVVIVVAAVIELWRRRGRSWEAWAALVLAPSGWLAYIVWVGVRVGDPLGWFTIQSGWGSRFDGGIFTAHTLVIVLADPTKLQYVVVALVLLAAVALWAWSAIERQPWPLLVYSGLILFTAIGTAGYFQSKARLILPAFPLLYPIARLLARAPRAAQVVALAVAAVASAAFGAYLLTAAPYSP